MALRMEGEFDLATREQLMWRLQDAESLGCNVVEIDASRVTHIDVGSLRVLAQAHARLVENGGHLVVVGQSHIFSLVRHLAGFESCVLVEAAETDSRPLLRLLEARRGARAAGTS
jgi:anti-anti-sigma factor